MILNVENLMHGFGDRAIFNNVSFRLLAGEHIGLVGVNVGGILIVLIVVAFIAFIVKPNMLTGLSLIGLCIAFFVCLVISLNVSMRYMSGLELALILGTIGVGVGFIIKGLLGVNKADKHNKKNK